MSQTGRAFQGGCGVRCATGTGPAGVLPPWYAEPMPLRRDMTARVVSYLPLDVADQLARRADANGLTVSAMAAALIKLALENVVDDRPADPEPRSPVDDARRVREDPEYAAWLRARRG